MQSNDRENPVLLNCDLLEVDQHSWNSDGYEILSDEETWVDLGENTDVEVDAKSSGSIRDIPLKNENAFSKPVFEEILNHQDREPIELACVQPLPVNGVKEIDMNINEEKTEFETEVDRCGIICEGLNGNKKSTPVDVTAVELVEVCEASKVSFADSIVKTPDNSKASKHEEENRENEEKATVDVSKYVLSVHKSIDEMDATTTNIELIALPREISIKAADEVNHDLDKDVKGKAKDDSEQEVENNAAMDDNAEMAQESALWASTEVVNRETLEVPAEVKEIPLNAIDTATAMVNEFHLMEHLNRTCGVKKALAWGLVVGVLLAMIPSMTLLWTHEDQGRKENEEVNRKHPLNNEITPIVISRQQVVREHDGSKTIELDEFIAVKRRPNVPEVCENKWNVISEDYMTNLYEKMEVEKNVETSNTSCGNSNVQNENLPKEVLSEEQWNMMFKYREEIQKNINEEYARFGISSSKDYDKCKASLQYAVDPIPGTNYSLDFTECKETLLASAHAVERFLNPLIDYAHVNVIFYDKSSAKELYKMALFALTSKLTILHEQLQRKPRSEDIEQWRQRRFKYVSAMLLQIEWYDLLDQEEKPEQLAESCEFFKSLYENSSDPNDREIGETAALWLNLLHEVDHPTYVDKNGYNPEVTRIYLLLEQKYRDATGLEISNHKDKDFMGPLQNDLLDGMESCLGDTMQLPHDPFMLCENHIYDALYRLIAYVNACIANGVLNSINLNYSIAKEHYLEASLACEMIFHVANSSWSPFEIQLQQYEDFPWLYRASCHVKSMFIRLSWLQYYSEQSLTVLRSSLDEFQRNEEYRCDTTLLKEAANWNDILDRRQNLSSLALENMANLKQALSVYILAN